MISKSSSKYVGRWEYSRGGDVGGCIPPLKYVGYNNIMLGMLLKFCKPLWKALKHSSAFRLRIFKELVPTFPWYWEGFSRLWELHCVVMVEDPELSFLLKDMIVLIVDMGGKYVGGGCGGVVNVVVVVDVVVDMEGKNLLR
ncbi:hypothetical protein M0R45_000791 [Rubus argutus]|uniref:Uncharacterized protein n=1 Tax=Rubus argutus TaxID=59490 RepID=A0AAW1VM93_RUBAR